jgi:autotransporter-associated beta strand protein
MKFILLRSFLALAGSAVLIAPLAGAATFYWDTDGATAGSGGATPSSTWSTGGTTWSTDSTGSTATSALTTTSLDDLTFSAGSDATGSYTITLSGTQSAHLLTFEEGAATLSSGTLSLGSGGGITVNAGSGDPIISSGLTITGGQTFNVGTGRTLTLNTGTFTRSAGATLNVQGAGTVNTTMTNLAVGSLSNNIIGPWASFGTGASTTYATINGSNNITGLGYTGGTDGTSVTDATGLATSATTNYSFGGAGAAIAGNSFNTLRYTGAGGTMTNAFSTNGIMNVGGGALTFSGAVTIGSTKELVVNAANGDVTLSATIANNAGGASALTKLGTGTLTLSGNNTYSGATNINSGTLTLARSGATNGLQNSPTVNVAAGAVFQLTAYDNQFLASVVMNINGTYLVTNSSAQSFSGATINLINGGIIDTGSLTTGGTNGTGSNNSWGAITFNGGANSTIAATGAGNIIQGTNNSLGVQTGRTLTLSTPGTSDALTISGKINAPGGNGGSIIKTGTGVVVLSAANAYTGTTTIQAGSLVAGAAAPSGSAGAFGNAASALVLGNGSTGASDAPAVLINGAFTVGRAITVGSVSNTNAYNAIIGGSNTSGTSTYSGNITLNTTASNYTVTLQAATGGTVNFTTGTWTTNNKAINIGSSGNAGTVRLSNSLSTTGAVNVNYGTFQVNSTLGGSGSAVTVASGATLQGTGTISKSVTINAGGTLAAGNSIESLATGDLTMVGAAIFAYEMNNDAVAGVAGDLTAVTGNLTLDSGNVSILNLYELGAGSWTAGEKLTLIAYSGSWNNGLFSYNSSTLADDSTISFSGANWTFNYNDTSAGGNYTGDLTGMTSYITMTVIPEPSVALLGGLGFLMLLRRRR